ncbi:uncharacterized protein LOC119648965 [Hermetia illucens]|uniref:uncharacterized protein LOC119648965 n=1 Tax=Hermetia illucens TaxID=343691 RepID=UPI0018CC28A7|nr:uncharacterized protein LOC119648965 [Hermetia illucens]
MKFLITTLVFCACSYLILAESRRPGQDFIDKVDDEDKGDFIRFHLARAVNKYGNLQNKINIRSDTDIPQDKYDDFMEATPPKDFHKNLYDWARNDLNLTDPMITNLVTVTVVCYTDSDVCYNPNDVGSLCCPF